MFALIFNKGMPARVSLWSSTWFLIFFHLIIFLSAYHVYRLVFPCGIKSMHVIKIEKYRDQLIIINN